MHHANRFLYLFFQPDAIFDNSVLNTHAFEKGNHRRAGKRIDKAVSRVFKGAGIGNQKEYGNAESFAQGQQVVTGDIDAGAFGVERCLLAAKEAPAAMVNPSASLETATVLKLSSA
jgi:hypothetical protein